MQLEYPEYATIDGVDYKIDTDFRTALRCFDIIEDDEIDDYERAIAIIYLLFDFIPKEEEVEKFLDKVKIYLQCGKTDEEEQQTKKDMDFKQDYGLITSSFMSDYRMDLSKENLHFWHFITLLEGLTEKCSLNRVRELRTYDLSDEKDEKRKRKIQEMQKKVALKDNQIKQKKQYSTEELNSMEEFYKSIGE